MLDLARELGLALAGSEEFNVLIHARMNVAQDNELQRLIEAFKEKREEVVTLMENGSEEIISVSNDLDALQQQLFDNPLFIDLMDAENDFQVLLSSVNEEIARCLSDADPTGESTFESAVSCGCSHCSH